MTVTTVVSTTVSSVFICGINTRKTHKGGNYVYCLFIYLFYITNLIQNLEQISETEKRKPEVTRHK